jgi:hypothetical protein
LFALHSQPSEEEEDSRTDSPVPSLVQQQPNANGRPAAQQQQQQPPNPTGSQAEEEEDEEESQLCQTTFHIQMKIIIIVTNVHTASR